MKLKIRFLERLWPSRKPDNTPYTLSPADRKRVENRYAIGLVIFWLIVFLFLRLSGRAQNTGHIEVGNSIPDITFNSLLGYKSPDAKLSDFRGKYVILDFWATWCAPCVRMIPRIDSLQEQFKGRVQFISVTRDHKEVVEALLARVKHPENTGLIEAVDDTAITGFFGNATLPHFAWISTDGRFLRLTSDDAVNSKVIASVLESGRLTNDYDIGEEIPIDPRAPLFSLANPTADDSFTFRSVLTDYKPGIASGIYSDITQQADSVRVRRITARNQSITQLYQLAMSDGFKLFGWDRTLLLVKDTTALSSSAHGHDYLDWEKNGHAFCYELVLPQKYAGSAMARMRYDLASFFPKYKASVQKRPWRCLSLETLNGAINAPASGGNAAASFDPAGASMRNCYLYVFTRHMAHFLQKYRLPIVNNTGYHQKVDLDIHADLTDLAAVNSQLAKYNLHLVTRELEQEVLVIEDN